VQALSDEGGICLKATALPWHEALPEHARIQALIDSDDYGVCFSAPVRARATLALAPVTRIGRIVKTPGCWLEDAQGQRHALKGGYAHFS